MAPLDLLPRRRLSWLVVVLVLLALPWPAPAMIFRVTHNRLAKRLDHIESFWFEPFPRSNFTLIIREFVAYDAHGVPDRKPSYPIGFAVESRRRVLEARMEERYYREEECFTDWLNDRVSLSLPWRNLNTVNQDMSRHIVIRDDISADRPQQVDLSAQLTDAKLYSFFFFNCNPDYTYSFDIEFHEYNVEDGAPSYLQRGDRPLPRLGVAFGLVQLALLAAWALRLRRPVGVLKVHWAMAALLAISALNALFGALHFYWADRTGHSLSMMSYEYHATRAAWSIGVLVTVTWIGLGSPNDFQPLGARPKFLLVVVGLLATVSTLSWSVAVSQSEGHPYWDFARVFYRISVGFAQLGSVLPYLVALYARSPSKQLAAACGYCWCTPCTAVALLLNRWKEIQLRKLLMLCSAVMLYYFMLSLNSFIRSQLHPTVTWYGDAFSDAVLFVWYVVMGVLMWPADHPLAAHELPQPPKRQRPATQATANFANFFAEGGDEEEDKSSEEDDPTGSRPLIRQQPAAAPPAAPPAQQQQQRASPAEAPFLRPGAATGFAETSPAPTKVAVAPSINFDHLLPDLSEGEDDVRRDPPAMQPIDML